MMATPIRNITILLIVSLAIIHGDPISADNRKLYDEITGDKVAIGKVLEIMKLLLEKFPNTINPASDDVSKLAEMFKNSPDVRNMLNKYIGFDLSADEMGKIFESIKKVNDNIKFLFKNLPEFRNLIMKLKTNADPVEFQKALEKFKKSPATQRVMQGAGNAGLKVNPEDFDTMFEVVNSVAPRPKPPTVDNNVPSQNVNPADNKIPNGDNHNNRPNEIPKVNVEPNGDHVKTVNSVPVQPGDREEFSTCGSTRTIVKAVPAILDSITTGSTSNYICVKMTYVYYSSLDLSVGDFTCTV